VEIPGALAARTSREMILEYHSYHLLDFVMEECTCVANFLVGEFTS
jgi:hypothetical protein